MTNLKGSLAFDNCKKLSTIDFAAFLTAPEIWKASSSFTNLAEHGTVLVAKNTTKQ